MTHFYCPSCGHTATLFHSSAHWLSGSCLACDLIFLVNWETGSVPFEPTPDELASLKGQTAGGDQ